MSIARTALLLLPALVLGCAGPTKRPQAELEKRVRLCNYGTFLEHDPDCMAARAEVGRRRHAEVGAAFAAYRTRWSIAHPHPSICRVASEDLRLLERAKDLLPNDEAAFLEHAATLIGCDYVDALRPFFDALQGKGDEGVLAMRIAEALTRKIGDKALLLALDRAYEPPWQLVSTAAASDYDCATIARLHDRGLEGYRAQLGVRAGCPALVGAVTEGLRASDPWVRARACLLAYDVPRVALTDALVSERVRLEREDPFVQVETTHTPTSSPNPPSGPALGELLTLPIRVLIMGLSRHGGTTTHHTIYPVREACFWSSLRRR